MIFLGLFFSCSSPLDIDADRGEKVIVGEKSDIELLPDTLDFGFVHPAKSKTLNFSIKNLTSNQYSIDFLTINNYNNLFTLTNFQSVKIQNKNSNSNTADFYITFAADSSYNHFIDSLYINDLKNPDLKLIATIPAVFGEDLEFEDVKIGSIGSKFLYLRNISNTDITISNLSINDNSFVIKGLDADALEIKAHSSRELIVTFEPINPITYTAQLTFSYNTFPYPVDNSITMTGIASN